MGVSVGGGGVVFFGLVFNHNGEMELVGIRREGVNEM